MSHLIGRVVTASSGKRKRTFSMFSLGCRYGVDYSLATNERTPPSFDYVTKNCKYKTLGAAVRATQPWYQEALDMSGTFDDEYTDEVWLWCTR